MRKFSLLFNSADKLSPLSFSTRVGWKHFREINTVITVLEPFQITLRPILFSIGSWDELLIPVGPLFHLEYDVLTSKSHLEGHLEMKKFFCNMYCLLKETYCSVVALILQLYKRTRLVFNFFVCPSEFTEPLTYYIPVKVKGLNCIA